MESAEPSGRFDFFEDNDSRVPSEDDVEKKKPWGKTGKSIGFPKMFRFWGKKSDSEKKKVLSELQEMGIRRYDYMVLHRATRGFSSTCLIGIGGSQVYKGMLEGQQEVAIKVMPMVQHSYARDFYLPEIKVLSEMRHRNVVQLLGWCHEAGHLALVFEFMTNGSLEDRLYIKDLPTLPWKVRYWRIAVGLASALQYLQEGLKERVVHRDIKPSNILLDSDFNPKLADFGLAKFASDLRAELDFPTTRVAGTIGYLDPQYAMTGKFCMEAADTYAFGMVALQIVSGRKLYDYVDTETTNLLEWVTELQEEGRILEAVDPNLGVEFDEREVERLLWVGLSCTRLDPKSRPPIKSILQLLNFEDPMSHTKFISEVGMTNHEAHSSPKRTPEVLNLFHRGADIDATAASTTSATDRVTFGVMESDGLSLGTFEDNYQEDEATPVLSPEHAIFDIGIPPGFGSAVGIENNRTDHHCNVLKDFVHSLLEMIKSEKNLPRFDEALKKIRICTAALVVMVGPPLDNWNALTQLVLRYLKERDEFCEFYGDDVSLTDDVTTLSSLDEGMRRCSRTIKEDGGRLKDSEERRARAQQRCTSLETELTDARRV